MGGKQNPKKPTRTRVYLQAGRFLCLPPFSSPLSVAAAFIGSRGDCCSCQLLQRSPSPWVTKRVAPNLLSLSLSKHRRGLGRVGAMPSGAGSRRDAPALPAPRPRGRPALWLEVPRGERAVSGCFPEHCYVHGTGLLPAQRAGDKFEKNSSYWAAFIGNLLLGDNLQVCPVPELSCYKPFRSDCYS